MIVFSTSVYPMSLEEITLRKKLVYYFNPCLKYLFNRYGARRFAEYGYNSCRQTAVFAAAFCRFELPEAEVKCYEGDFTDIIGGQEVDYTHAFCRLLYRTHDILIDISRTERCLLYTQTDFDSIYPRNAKCPDYLNTRLMVMRELPWRNMFAMESPEYITGIRPLVLFQEVCQMVSSLEDKSYGEKLDFARTMYHRFTKLTLEKGEFFD